MNCTCCKKPMQEVWIRGERSWRCNNCNPLLRINWKGEVG